MAQAAAESVLEPIETATVSNPSDVKRVNVVFSADQYNTLVNLAKMQNISLSDALRQAINVSNLIVRANADADTQILLKKGDAVQELKIVR
jgi:hypothetical protein